MKIVNIKKFIRSICIMLFIILILSIVCAKGTLSHKEVEYKSFYVSTGETLWSISKRLQKSNEYYKGQDIRYIIADMKNINGLDSSNIYEGQELMIPTI